MQNRHPLPKATRLLDVPIIHPGLDPSIGANINGPSLIRVPDWVSNPLGRYYLYFAHHKGRNIRLAFADDLKGPWTVHRPGALDLAGSHFVTKDLSVQQGLAGDGWGHFASNDDHIAHIASPHVLIDEDDRVIRMYYHGLMADGDQQSRVATSQNGLNFAAKPQLLGPPYFRVFAYDGWFYAVSWRGVFLRSSSWDGPFEPGPRLPDVENLDQPNRVIRHADVLLRDGVLYVFFTCIDDCPERILCSKISLADDWRKWTATVPWNVLEPELDWEGADISLARSKVGTAYCRCRELRDPCVFVVGDKTYLLYSGAGESGGIGLAELEF